MVEGDKRSRKREDELYTAFVVAAAVIIVVIIITAVAAKF